MPYLKEEDAFITWFQNRAATDGLLAAASLAEKLCNEHRINPDTSELSNICPQMRKVLAPLCIMDAVRELNEKTRLLTREHVLPTFSELRQIL